MDESEGAEAKPLTFRLAERSARSKTRNGFRYQWSEDSRVELGREKILCQVSWIASELRDEFDMK